MPDESPDKKKPSGWIQMAKYSELAVIFPASTFAGWLVGVALDRWLHTRWLYLVGLILGIIAGFVQLIRMVSADQGDE
jgi:ATP synthase protein I